MSNQQIENYIKHQRATGINDSIIKVDLKTAGWDETTIERYLNESKSSDVKSRNLVVYFTVLFIEILISIGSIFYWVISGNVLIWLFVGIGAVLSITSILGILAILRANLSKAFLTIPLYYLFGVQIINFAIDAILRKKLQIESADSVLNLLGTDIGTEYTNSSLFIILALRVIELILLTGILFIYRKTIGLNNFSKLPWKDFFALKPANAEIRKFTKVLGLTTFVMILITLPPQLWIIFSSKQNLGLPGLLLQMMSIAAYLISVIILLIISLISFVKLKINAFTVITYWIFFSGLLLLGPGFFGAASIGLTIYSEYKHEQKQEDDKQDLENFDISITLISDTISTVNSQIPSGTSRGSVPIKYTYNYEVNIQNNTNKEFQATITEDIGIPDPNSQNSLEKFTTTSYQEGVVTIRPGSNTYKHSVYMDFYASETYTPDFSRNPKVKVMVKNHLNNAEKEFLLDTQIENWQEIFDQQEEFKDCMQLQRNNVSRCI